MSRQIFFKYSTGPYGWLHNFSLYPIKYNGEMYATSEHLYQSLKFSDPISKKFIREASTPKKAAQIGRTLPNVRMDWEEVKVDIMEGVLRYKLAQHYLLEQKLLDTGDAEIIEQSAHDSFWGQLPNGQGRNELGKLWQKIRAELRLREEASDRMVNGN